MINWNNRWRKMSIWRMEDDTEKVGKIGQIALEKNKTGSSSVGPLGSTRRSRCSSPRLCFTDCSILVVLKSSTRAEGIVRQAMCAAHACSWMHIASIKRSIVLQTCLLQSPPLHTRVSWYVLNSDSKVLTLPCYPHQSCDHVLRDSLLLWGR